MNYEEFIEQNRKEKPPLGLKPEIIHLEQRREEVTEVMANYMLAREAIPRLWMEELIHIKERIDYLNTLPNKGIL